MAFEKYIIGDETVVKRMSIHLFIALVNEFICDQLSKNDVLSDIESHLNVTLTNDEKSDLQDLMDAIDNETGTPAKSVLSEEMYHVFIIAFEGERYNTKALLKTRFNWL